MGLFSTFANIPPSEVVAEPRRETPDNVVSRARPMASLIAVAASDDLRPSRVGTRNARSVSAWQGRPIFPTTPSTRSASMMLQRASDCLAVWSRLREP